jgi:hypothetical protein
VIPKQPEKLRRLVPLARVASVPASLAFYAKLGFDLVNALGGDEPHWAWLRSGQADLMIERATLPVVSEQQAVLFYLYVDDVYRFHTAISQAGVTAGELVFPTHSPMGEFRVVDPDGYVLLVGQNY